MRMILILLTINFKLDYWPKWIPFYLADMSSIHIQEIDNKLLDLIKKRAEETGLGLEETIKILLAEAVGLDTNEMGRNKFEEFCGVWVDSDLKEFNKAIYDFSHIDPSD